MVIETYEEIKEKERHDVSYKKTMGSDLYIAPRHYLKFDTIEKDIHCYTYAVRSLGDIKGKRVLDLGCGTGWFSVILAKRGALVEGIEISSVAVEIAKKRAEVNNVYDTVNFKEMSFYDLNFPDNYFDLIIGLSVLHHSRDKDRLCHSLHRVLKSNGRIVFNEPFGNMMFLERLRLIVPVEVDEEDKTHWSEQVKYRDLNVFKMSFKTRYKEFQLISRLDRIIHNKQAIQLMGEIDLMLLDKFRFLRPYARDIVIVLEKL
jgi:ubiquinone/menaquinone biosynthesis C-methylase UbiE